MSDYLSGAPYKHIVSQFHFEILCTAENVYVTNVLAYCRRDKKMFLMLVTGLLTKQSFVNGQTTALIKSIGLHNKFLFIDSVSK